MINTQQTFHCFANQKQ